MVKTVIPRETGFPGLWKKLHAFLHPQGVYALRKWFQRHKKPRVIRFDTTWEERLNCD